MSFLRLIARSWMHHRRLHAGLFLGAMLACAILTGAMLVGDSVRASLQGIAAARLGRIQYAMEWKNRFFAQDLARRLAAAGAPMPTAALLALKGIAALPPEVNPQGNQLNQVQILGVDSDFWALAPQPACQVPLGPQEAAINQKTAQALGLAPGETLLLRFAKPGMMPLDAPLSAQEEKPLLSTFLKVAVILSDQQLGRFNLAANQVTPCNLFVNRAWLQEQTGLEGRANLLLAGGNLALGEIQQALAQSWALDHLGLSLRTHPSGLVQLESDRVFLDDEVLRVASGIPGALPTLTYLVNSIAKENRSTPYSFVEAGPVPPDLKDHEVIINQWLADLLQASPGDTLDVAYLQLLPDNTFVERQRAFKVHSVRNMTDLQIEREMAPRFPGLSEVESCKDWRIGMPMDPQRLEDPGNEAYWKQFGQTPKLLATLHAGQAMWANRFGAATAVRFTDPALDEAEIKRRLHEGIDPGKIGLQFLPTAQLAQNAVNQAIDFGSLFLGMSMFLIAAALVLQGLLCAFGLQQRAPEMGILLALGFTRRRIRELLFLEAMPSALIGAASGAVAAVFYARALLFAIERYWPAAAAGTTLRFHAEPATILHGILAALLCAILVACAGIARATRFSPHQLLTLDFPSAPLPPRPRNFPWFFLLSTVSLGLAALVVAYRVWSRPESMTASFFAIGALLLAAAMNGYGAFLRYIARRPAFQRPSLAKMLLANLARRPARSLGVAGLTACGCFLVFAVSAMQQNVALRVHERSSGAGGFDLFAESTIPFTGSPEQIAQAFQADIVPLRVRDGDDAGCLNLNHAQLPKLYGVSPDRLASLGAFAPRDKLNTLWNALQSPLPAGQIPALAGDLDTAIWGLKKNIGDVLPYRDEAGRECSLKLVGNLPMRLSLFQGALLISDDAFTRLFPSEAGFRAFLVNVPGASPEQSAIRLNRLFERFGMQTVPAVDRLREFYAVEATYLTMFLLLGGFGLILGAGGAGIVVLRNLFERRAEIAILHALGYPHKTLFVLMLAEHGALVLIGMFLGTGAAAAAILPLVYWSQTTVSLPLQAALFITIICANLFCTAMMVAAGLPKNPTPCLRGE